jgi:hypothetical protein
MFTLRFGIEGVCTLAIGNGRFLYRDEESVPDLAPEISTPEVVAAITKRAVKMDLCSRNITDLRCPPTIACNFIVQN